MTDANNPDKKLGDHTGADIENIAPNQTTSVEEQKSPDWEDVCSPDSPPMHPDLAAYFEADKHKTAALGEENTLAEIEQVTASDNPTNTVEASTIEQGMPKEQEQAEISDNLHDIAKTHLANDTQDTQKDIDDNKETTITRDIIENRTVETSVDDGTEEMDEEERPQTIRDHFIELRKRMTLMLLFAIAGLIICYPFSMQIFDILVTPLKQAMPDGKGSFAIIAPGEGFFTSLKVSFVGGIFVASPLIFYQIWAFIAPGLYETERKYLLPIAFFSAFFFIGGGLFCYFVVFPFAFEFFMSYTSSEIQAMLSLSQTLGFILQLLIAFGLIFELPLFVFFLARMGLITADWMRSMRRYAILVNVIIAAILTPPDVISQGLMAAPMLVLYELSIFVAAIFGRKKPEEKTEEVEDETAQAV